MFAGFPKVPVWLRKFCSHVLSQKLMRPRGVQYVLRGMLEGTSTVLRGMLEGTTGMYSIPG